MGHARMEVISVPAREPVPAAGGGDAGSDDAVGRAAGAGSRQFGDAARGALGGGGAFWRRKIHGSAPAGGAAAAHQW